MATINTTTRSEQSPPTLFLFGSNEYGNLGLGHEEDVFIPSKVLISSLSANEEEIVLIGCGGTHLVLLTKNNDLFIAGRNDYQQIVQNKLIAKQTVPILYEFFRSTLNHSSYLNSTLLKKPKIINICCGYNHTVLLCEDGRVFAFGLNEHGELGVHPTKQTAKEDNVVITKPVCVDLGRGSCRKISTKGNHTLALMTNGVVFGWGSNESNQISSSNESIISPPTEIQELKLYNIDNIYCGCSHSFATYSNGNGLLSWGQNNQSQCGVPSNLQKIINTPTKILNFDGRRISSISCGFAHSLFLLLEQDVVLTCGGNQFGECGLGINEEIKKPTRIESICHSGIKSCVAGYYNSYFALQDGVYSCGLGEHGTLGISNNDTSDQWLPIKISTIPIEFTEGTMSASSFFAILPPSPSFNHTSNLFSANTLSEDLLQAFNLNLMADITLQAGEDGGIFFCSRCIIMARCLKLNKEIENKTGITSQNIRTNGRDLIPNVCLNKINSQTLKRFLIYLYSDYVFIDDASLSEILLLAHCANYFGILRLLCICEDEISNLLDNENVILVLREGCDLELLTIKRICIEYIHANYSGAVSSRNRIVVESLGNQPDLLAEVVGLTSPDFSESLLYNLPSQIPCPASTLEFDLLSLLENGNNYSDCVFVAMMDNSKNMENNFIEDFPDRPTMKKVGFLCHRAILSSRCSFFANVFRCYYLLKENGDSAQITEEERRRVELVFDTNVKFDEDGRIILKEINSSSPEALHCLLQFLYSDTIHSLKLEFAVDVLQMCVVYGIGSSKLAHECENLLRLNCKPENAIDTLCIAYQLKRQALQYFTIEYVCENLMDCVDQDSGNLLKDCFLDFPELGFDLFISMSAKLKQKSSNKKLF